MTAVLRQAQDVPWPTPRRSPTDPYGTVAVNGTAAQFDGSDSYTEEPPYAVTGAWLRVRQAGPPDSCRGMGEHGTQDYG